MKVQQNKTQQSHKAYKAVQVRTSLQSGMNEALNLPSELLTLFPNFKQCIRKSGTFIIGGFLAFPTFLIILRVGTSPMLISRSKAFAAETKKEKYWNKNKHISSMNWAKNSYPQAKNENGVSLKCIQLQQASFSPIKTR